MEPLPSRRLRFVRRFAVIVKFFSSHNLISASDALALMLAEAEAKTRQGWRVASAEPE